MEYFPRSKRRVVRRELPTPAPVHHFSPEEIRAYAAELGVPVSKHLRQAETVAEVAHA